MVWRSSLLVSMEDAPFAGPRVTCYLLMVFPTWRQGWMTLASHAGPGSDGRALSAGVEARRVPEVVKGL